LSTSPAPSVRPRVLPDGLEPQGGPIVVDGNLGNRVEADAGRIFPDAVAVDVACLLRRALGVRDPKYTVHLQLSLAPGKLPDHSRPVLGENKDHREPANVLGYQARASREWAKQIFTLRRCRLDIKRPTGLQPELLCH